MRNAYLIKYGGDREIAGALARGVDAGMRAQLRNWDNEAVMRVALHRGRGSEYWETMIAEARELYDTPEPCRVARWLLAVWGLICYLTSLAYHAQDRLLERRP